MRNNELHPSDAVATVRGSTLIMGASDGQHSVYIVRREIGTRRYVYTVCDEYGTYCVDACRGSALHRWQDRWAELGTKVYGTTDLWALKLIAREHRPVALFYIMSSNGMGTHARGEDGEMLAGLPEMRGIVPTFGPMQIEPAVAFCQKHGAAHYTVAPREAVESVFPASDLPQNAKAISRLEREEFNTFAREFASV